MKNLKEKLTVWNFLYLVGFGSYVTGMIVLLKYGIIALEPTVRQYADTDWLSEGIMRVVIGVSLTFAVRKRKTVDLFKGFVQ